MSEDGSGRESAGNADKNREQQERDRQAKQREQLRKQEFKPAAKKDEREQSKTVKQKEKNEKREERSERGGKSQEQNSKEHSAGPEPRQQEGHETKKEGFHSSRDGVRLPDISGKSKVYEHSAPSEFDQKRVSMSKDEVDEQGASFFNVLRTAEEKDKQGLSPLDGLRSSGGKDDQSPSHFDGLRQSRKTGEQGPSPFDVLRGPGETGKQVAQTGGFRSLRDGVLFPDITGKSRGHEQLTPIDFDRLRAKSASEKVGEKPLDAPQLSGEQSQAATRVVIGEWMLNAAEVLEQQNEQLGKAQQHFEEQLKQKSQIIRPVQIDNSLRKEPNINQELMLRFLEGRLRESGVNNVGRDELIPAYKRVSRDDGWKYSKDKDAVRSLVEKKLDAGEKTLDFYSNLDSVKAVIAEVKKERAWRAEKIRKGMEKLHNAPDFAGRIMADFYIAHVNGAINIINDAWTLASYGPRKLGLDMGKLPKVPYLSTYGREHPEMEFAASLSLGGIATKAAFGLLRTVGPSASSTLTGLTFGGKDISQGIFQATKAYLATGIIVETAPVAAKAVVNLRILSSPDSTPEQKNSAAKELKTTLGMLAGAAMIGRVIRSPGTEKAGIQMGHGELHGGASGVPYVGTGRTSSNRPDAGGKRKELKPLGEDAPEVAALTDRAVDQGKGEAKADRNYEQGWQERPGARGRTELARHIPEIQAHTPGGAKHFEEWWDALTPGDLRQLLADKGTKTKRGAREVIEANVRAYDRKLAGDDAQLAGNALPSGYHEWLKVSKLQTYKEWGISMSDIRELRSLTSRTVGKSFQHGGQGSTRMHRELDRMVENSGDYNQFRRRLNDWADKELGGREHLPKRLRMRIAE